MAGFFKDEETNMEVMFMNSGDLNYDKIMDAMADRIAHTINVFQATDILEWLLANPELVERFTREKAMTPERLLIAKKVRIGSGEDQINSDNAVEKVTSGIQEMLDDFREYCSANQQHIGIGIQAMLSGEGEKNA